MLYQTSKLKSLPKHISQNLIYNMNWIDYKNGKMTSDDFTKSTIQFLNHLTN